MKPKNHARAVRYRQLALAEPDRAKAAVLLTIADEAERDVLCTVDSTNLGYTRQGAQNIPIQPKQATCRSCRPGPKPSGGAAVALLKTDGDP
jgi:hypothetical protein